MAYTVPHTWVPGDFLRASWLNYTTDDLEDHEARILTLEGATAGTGDVVGPASATDNALARFNTTTGKLVQNSGITVADGATGTLAGSNSGDVTLAGTPDYITVSGQVITRGLVDLASDITGDLPFANLTPATGASKLLGRGSAAGGGDYQEITLGTNLSYSGTTLNASGGAGGGDVTGPASSVDAELAVFDSTSGKLLKRATGTGPVKVTSGVYSIAAINLSGAEVTGDLQFANLAPLSASKLAGRGSAGGTGDIQEITVGSGLSMTGATLSATGSGSGDVVGPGTSVEKEVALFDGTTGALLERATGTGIARVTSGVWGTPGPVDLTAEVTGDLPFANLAQLAASKLAGRGSAGGTGDLEAITLGTNLSMSGTTLNATGGGGSSKPWLFFRALEGAPPASNPATFNVRNATPVLEFDTTTQEATVFVGVLPTGYAGGGLKVTVHWAAATATSGTIGWDAAIERIGVGSQDLDSDGFATAQTITAATVPGTSGHVATSNVTLTDGAQIDSLAAGEAFRLRIRRDVATDTATGDAQLLTVVVEEP